VCVYRSGNFLDGLKCSGVAVYGIVAGSFHKEDPLTDVDRRNALSFLTDKEQRKSWEGHNGVKIAHFRRENGVCAWQHLNTGKGMNWLKETKKRCQWSETDSQDTRITEIWIYIGKERQVARERQRGRARTDPKNVGS